MTNGLIGTVNFLKNVNPVTALVPNIPEVHNESRATDKNDFANGELGGKVFFAGESAVVGGVGGVAAKGPVLAKTGEELAEEASVAAPKPVESPAPGGQSAATTKTDADFSADLNQTNATSRSGHSNAGNKQLNEAMAKDPALRKKIETKYGDDAFDRTSTSNGGRRNPKGAEWDHNSTDSSKLDLKSKDDHAQKTRTEGQAGGGWKKFHKDKTTSSSDQ